ECGAAGGLRCGEGQQRVREVTPLLVGVDDVHVVRDAGRGPRPAPVSAVISSRIAPSQEPAYRRWEQRIAAAQATAPGFQGYRLEQPISGVQGDWVVIPRFASDAPLQGWLRSPRPTALPPGASGVTAADHPPRRRAGLR